MSSLRDVCFQHIQEQYWYGLYGDFKLIIDKNTGYFNATKLCQDGGRRFYHWMENKRSKEMLQYYTPNSSTPNTVDRPKYVVKGGSKNDIKISGTYVREELFLDIACWISASFYHKCYEIIKKYFILKFKTNYQTDNAALISKLQDIESQLSQLRCRNEMLEKYVEDISPKVEEPSKRHITHKYNDFKLVNISIR